VALLAFVVCVPAAIVIYAATARHPESLAAGDSIASLAAVDLAGTPRRLDSGSPDGRSHVWLIVSASCVVCRAELAEMQKASAPFSHVTIVSFSSPDETREFMKQFPRLRPQTVIDARGTLQRVYGRFRTPTGLLIDSRGALVQKWHGLRPDLMRVAG
jgi:hypothetical protein